MQDVLSRQSGKTNEWLEIYIAKTKCYFIYNLGIVVKILRVYLTVHLSRFLNSDIFITELRAHILRG